MSENTHDPTEKAVALLQSIGLDITYTDEGLRVVAEQIGRAYRADERVKARERVEALSSIRSIYDAPRDRYVECVAVDDAADAAGGGE